MTRVMAYYTYELNMLYRLRLGRTTGPERQIYREILVPRGLVIGEAGLNLLKKQC
jgi:hypothetical protein